MQMQWQRNMEFFLHRIVSFNLPDEDQDDVLQVNPC